MKTKNESMPSFIKYVLYIMVIVAPLSCTSSNVGNLRSIHALLGCQDLEVKNDLLYSLEGIKTFAKNNNIIISLDVNDRRCGYLLTQYTEQYTEGALTDYDLMLKAKKFFELP